MTTYERWKSYSDVFSVSFFWSNDLNEKFCGRKPEDAWNYVKIWMNSQRSMIMNPSGNRFRLNQHTRSERSSNQFSYFSFRKSLILLPILHHSFFYSWFPSVPLLFFFLLCLWVESQRLLSSLRHFSNPSRSWLHSSLANLPFYHLTAQNYSTMI